MSLLRFLGLSRDDERNEPQSIQRIARELDALEPESASLLAAFAYVLARVAEADLRIEGEEIAAMERSLREVAELDEREARLAVEIASTQVDERGATDNYLVTREFRRASSRSERVRLIRCLFQTAAADGTISSSESDEVLAISEELGFSRKEALALRAEWRDKLAEFQARPKNA